MKRNKTFSIFTAGLIASIILGACSAQPAPEPAETQAPPVPETVAETEAPEEPSPIEAPTEAPTEPPTEAPAPAGEVSFANDVFPIIDSRCSRCHGKDRIEEGLIMLSYDELMAGSDNGPVIIPGDVEGSLLVELVATQEMPKRGPKLTPPQVQIISDWVAAGAPNN